MPKQKTPRQQQFEEILRECDGINSTYHQRDEDWATFKKEEFFRQLKDSNFTREEVTEFMQAKTFTAASGERQIDELKRDVQNVAENLRAEALADPSNQRPKNPPPARTVPTVPPPVRETKIGMTTQKTPRQQQFEEILRECDGINSTYHQRDEDWATFKKEEFFRQLKDSNFTPKEVTEYMQAKTFTAASGERQIDELKRDVQNVAENLRAEALADPSNQRPKNPPPAPTAPTVPTVPTVPHPVTDPIQTLTQSAIKLDEALKVCRNPASGLSWEVKSRNINGNNKEFNNFSTLATEIENAYNQGDLELAKNLSEFFYFACGNHPLDLNQAWIKIIAEESALCKIACQNIKFEDILRKCGGYASMKFPEEDGYRPFDREKFKDEIKEAGFTSKQITECAKGIERMANERDKEGITGLKGKVIRCAYEALADPGNTPKKRRNSLGESQKFKSTLKSVVDIGTDEFVEQLATYINGSSNPEGNISNGISQINAAETYQQNIFISFLVKKCHEKGRGDCRTVAKMLLDSSEFGCKEGLATAWLKYGKGGKQYASRNLSFFGNRYEITRKAESIMRNANKETTRKKPGL